MANSDESSEWILGNFVEEYWRDLADGNPHTLDHYLARFPNHIELITREYQLITAEESDASAGPELPLAQATASHPEGDESRGRVGPYELLRELGQGGQAVVWLARDSRLGRNVALKLLRSTGTMSQSLVERFRREAAITARLDHPGICAVHEVGFDGAPWIAMRYVEGQTLAAVIRQYALQSDGPLTFMDLVSNPVEAIGPDTSAEGAPVSGPSTPSSRAEIDSILELLEAIARALHCAHEAGIVHRDIKPGNIMVSPQGSPVILDFGIAAAEEEGEAALTLSGDLIGTPAYMSPEQISGSSGRADRRTDVYSLGVTLYECLTKRRPHHGPTREALYQSILNRKATHPASFNPKVSNDLHVVLQTAMEKDRHRRYATSEAFAEDLRRVRQRRPILARRPSTGMRFIRWGQRNPLGVAVMAALLIGASVSAWFAYEASQSTREALASEAVARERQARLLASSSVAAMKRSDLYEAMTWTAEALRLEESIVDADSAKRRTELRNRLGAISQRIPSIQFEWSLPPSIGEAITRQQLLPFIDPGSNSLVFASHRDDPSYAPARWTFDGRLLTSPLAKVSAALSNRHMSANGRWLTGIRNRNSIELWDANSGTISAQVTIPEEVQSDRMSLRVAQDGSRVAMFSTVQKTGNHASTEVLTIQRDSTSVISRYTTESSVTSQPKLTDLRILMHGDGSRIHDLKTGTALSPACPSGQISAISDSGNWIATGKTNGEVWTVSDNGTEATLLRPQLSSWASTLCFDAQTKHLAVSSGEGTTYVWRKQNSKTDPREHDSWQMIREFPTPLPPGSGAFSPDGLQLALSSGSREIQVVGIGVRERERRMLTHPEGIASVLWTDQGRRIMVIGRRGLVRVWDLAAHATKLDHVHCGRAPVSVVRYSPDGELVASGSQDGTFRVLGSSTRRLIRGPIRLPQSLNYLSWGSSSDRLLTVFGPLAPTDEPASEGQGAQVWSPQTGSPLTQVLGTGVMGGRGSGRAWLVPHRDRVVLQFADKVNLYDLAIRKDVGQRGRDGSWLLSQSAFSDDGRHFVTLNRRALEVLDTQTAKRVHRFELDPQARSLAVHLSPSGRWALGASTASVHVFDLRMNQAVLKLPAEQVGVVQIIDTDEPKERFLLAGRNGSCRVFHLRTGQPEGPAFRAGRGIIFARLLPNADTVLTVSRNDGIGLWALQTGQPLSPPLLSGTEILCADLSPDLRELAVGRKDGLLTYWTLPKASTRTPQIALDFARSISSHHIDAAQQYVRLEHADGEFRSPISQGPHLDVTAEDARTWHHGLLACAQAEDSVRSSLTHLGSLLELGRSAGHTDSSISDLLELRAQLREAAGLPGALSDLNQAVAAAPHNPRIRSARGTHLADKNENRMAAADFAAAAQLQQDPLLWLRASLLYMKGESYKAADQAWSRAARLVLGSRLPAGLGSQPRKIRDLRHLAEKWKPLLTLLESPLKETSTGPHAKKRRTQRLLALGLASTVVDQWSVARNHFRAVADSEPTDVRAWWGLAVTQLFNPAVKRESINTLIATGLTIDPNHIPLQILRLRLSPQGMDRGVLIDELARSSIEDDYAGDVLSIRGTWELKQRNWAQASQHLERALDLAGSNAPASTTHDYGISLAELQNWSAASRAFRLAGSRRPDQLPYLIDWAVTARKVAAPDYQRARSMVLSHLDTWRGQAPPSKLVRSMVTLGIGMERLERLERSLCLRLGDDAPEPWDGLLVGMVLSRRGCFEEAREWFSRERERAADDQTRCWANLELALALHGLDAHDAASATLLRARLLLQGLPRGEVPWDERLFLNRLTKQVESRVAESASDAKRWRQSLQAPLIAGLESITAQLDSKSEAEISARISMGRKLFQIGRHQQAQDQYQQLTKLGKRQGFPLSGSLPRVVGPPLPLHKYPEFTVEAKVHNLNGSFLSYALDLGDWTGWSAPTGNWLGAKGSLLRAIPGWNHLALSYDGKTQRIFLNGEILTTLNAPPPRPSPRSVVMGRGHGIIAELRISKRARYLTPFKPEPHWQPDDDTLLHWDFSKVEGRRVIDLSGHGGHGEILSAWWLGPYPR